MLRHHPATVATTTIGLRDRLETWQTIEVRGADPVVEGLSPGSHRAPHLSTR
jgi:hypothetical protein